MIDVICEYSGELITITTSIIHHKLSLSATEELFLYLKQRSQHLAPSVACACAYISIHRRLQYIHEKETKIQREKTKI
jgi:hypothetical protein